MAQSLGSFLKQYMPTGLFPRSLLIIVMPVVVTQIVVAFVFLERHWSTVTQRLASVAVSDIALLTRLRMQELGGDGTQLSQLANDTFDMSVAFLPGDSLPDPAPKPVIALLDTSLAKEIQSQINRPFWIDTATYDHYIDVRVLLPGEVMRVLMQRERVYATNSYIFLIWMTGTSALLLLISGIFLRNQIRPIQRLAEAAERFGKGMDMPHFRPSGASEVRRASAAFMEMRDRIQRQIEQRTTMLAGVSHDLRTPLTRLKLQTAMLPAGQDADALQSDIDEMEDMLEDYLAFAKGDAGEHPRPIVLSAFMANIHSDALRRWPHVQVKLTDSIDHRLTLKPNAFKRCVANIVNNACAHAGSVHLAAKLDKSGKLVEFTIDDDGPGIPENKLEDVFRPFYRLDDSRNTQSGGTGLGMAIALDIARSHGGDITLGRSTLGGLHASIRIPA